MYNFHRFLRFCDVIAGTYSLIGDVLGQMSKFIQQCTWTTFLRYPIRGWGQALPVEPRRTYVPRASGTRGDNLICRFIQASKQRTL